MTSKEQLLPVTGALKCCPFCGDTDEFNPSVSTAYGYAEPGDLDLGTIGNPEAGLVEKGRYVECDKCGACGSTEATEAEAITRWNTRHDSQAELVEALRALLTEAEAFATAIPPYGNSEALIGARNLLARLESPAS